jgi:hypothetical protein
MKQRSPAPPSKSCGECNLCCIELPIETPELRKKAQTPCSHLTTKGCGIYETRFPICRQFLCGWRLFPELDADWRPDRSGVMILQVPQISIPKIYQPAGHGVQLLITGGEAAVTRPGFAEYVLDQVSRGVAVYMTATTPRALLNEYLQPLAAPENLPAARRIILHLYRLLMAAKAGKGFLGMLPYFYRLHVEKQWAALKK